MSLRSWSGILLALPAFAFVACSGSSPRFTSKDRIITPPSDASPYQLQGIASYYADEFNGRKTANGETYDMHSLTAAHRTLPFNTTVKVLNLLNRRTTIVRINDRGPFKDERLIDVSLEAAQQLGLIGEGTAPVSLEILQLGPPSK